MAGPAGKPAPNDAPLSDALPTTTRRVTPTARRFSASAATAVTAVAIPLNSVVRSLSFGRKNPKQQQPAPRAAVVEVALYRASAAVPLGITLTTAANSAPKGGGVLIAAIAPGSVAAKCVRVRQGDLILAVNGVKVVDCRHGAQLLREAAGVIQLVACHVGLPDGWQELTDRKGGLIYRHAELQLTSHCHPAAIELRAESETLSPLKKRRPSADVCAPCSSGFPSGGATARAHWHAAFHTVSLVNSLAGEVERSDDGRGLGLCSGGAPGAREMPRSERV